MAGRAHSTFGQNEREAIMYKHHICGLAVGIVLIGGCGGSGGDADVGDSGGVDVGDIADDLEAVQESQGGGGATLTANGQTWEFASVLCAFGEEQIGQDGAVFNLSAIADGLQLYASIDDAGASHSLSLNDIEDFENPSVALSIDPFIGGAVGAPPEFLTLDDKTVTGEVVMIDDTTGQPTTEPAQLSATCP